MSVSALSTNIHHYASSPVTPNSSNLGPFEHPLVVCALILTSIFFLYYICQPQKPQTRESCRCDLECAICDCWDDLPSPAVGCMSCLALLAKEPQDDVTAVCPECGVLLCYASDSEGDTETHGVKSAVEAAASARQKCAAEDERYTLVAKLNDGEEIC